MDMAIDRARTALAQVFFQRCFYLFVAVLALIMTVLLFEPTPHARVLLNAANLLVLVAAVAAIGRTRLSFVIALLLAAPTLLFQLLAIDEGDSRFLLHSWAFGAALYAATVGYLLRYVFQREVMTADKLYGAAAAFLLLGVLWSNLYQILLHFYPGALHMNGAPMTLAPPSTMLYFSFVTLTATGMSDILPVHPAARMLCALEMITGVLFIAVLIARLAGSYPPPERE